MSNPITWRNVNGPSVSDGVASLMNAAQNSFAGGFNALDKELTKQNALVKTNADAYSNNITNEVKAKLLSAQTPEEYAALHQSGYLGQQQEQYGAALNMDKLSETLTNRPQQLQQAAITGVNYRNAALEEQFKGANAQGMQIAMGGTNEQMQAWGEANQGNPLVYKAMQAMQERQMKERDFSLRQNAQNQSASYQNASLANQSRSITNQEETTQFNRERAVKADESAAAAKLVEASSKAAQREEDNFKAYKDTTSYSLGKLGDGKSAELISKTLGDNKEMNPRQKLLIAEHIANTYPDGKFEVPITKMVDGKPVTGTTRVDIPTGKLLAAIRATYDSWGTSNGADNMKAMLEKSMLDPQILAEAVEISNRESKLTGRNPAPATIDPEVQKNVDMLKGSFAEGASTANAPVTNPVDNSFKPTLSPLDPANTEKPRGQAATWLNEQSTKQKATKLPATAAPLQSIKGTETPAVKATETVSINADTGASTTSEKPLEVPKNVKWSQAEEVGIDKIGKDVLKRKAIERATEKRPVFVATFDNIRVNDGDTFKATEKGGEGREVNCRIDMIDAPETAKKGRDGKPDQPGQPGGEEAKKALDDMLKAGEVRIWVSRSIPGKDGKPDNYGRDFCQVEVQGKNVGMELVKNNLAYIYENYVGNPNYADANAVEKLARSKGGSVLSGEKPGDYRRRYKE